MSQETMNCPACGRRTPVARAKCMYCGAQLPVTKIEAAPPQRPIESHELAFNTVLEPAGIKNDDTVHNLLASALQIEMSEARAFIAAQKRVPVARCQVHHEAELIAALIRTCGLKASVVADEEFKLGLPLVRARRISRSADAINIQSSSGELILAPTEISLIVVGALKNNRVEYTEGIAGTRGQSIEVKDSAEFSSDEMLLDIYSTTLETSFRLRAGAFDYSGLVRPLSFRAEMNFQAAVRVLTEIAPQATLDSDFSRIRRLLARAWPERSHTEAEGIKRVGLAARPVARASVVSDNRDQFERYSRLMFLSAQSSVAARDENQQIARPADSETDTVPELTHQG